MIKAAPLHFACACLITAIMAGILWYATFSTALSLKTSTIEAYKERFDNFNSALKENSSQSPQVMIYTTDPNAEKLIPQTTNAAALAYRTDGQGALFMWDTKSQSWR